MESSTKRVTANVTHNSLSDSKAVNEICVFNKQSQSCWQATKGVGVDRGSGYIDMCILHKGKGVEIHLS